MCQSVYAFTFLCVFSRDVYSDIPDLLSWIRYEALHSYYRPLLFLFSFPFLFFITASRRFTVSFTAQEIPTLYLVPIKRRTWDLLVFIWLFDWLDGCLGLDPRIEAFLIFSICLLCMDLGGFLFLILIFFLFRFISFLPANTILEEAGPN